MPSVNLTSNASGGGVSISTSVNRSVDSASGLEPAIPAGKVVTAWLKTVSPEMTWEWKHQIYIYKRLRRITEGKTKRLMNRAILRLDEINVSQAQK